MAKLNHVNDEDFAEEVLESSQPVLVDFWAEWCHPCHMIAPHVEAIANDYKGVLKVAKMDVDENPVTQGQYGIMSIPTLMLFKDGEVVERLMGARPKDQILAKILPHLDRQQA
ncbi:MAG: thioredoxin [Candidatus Promineifilaceae bacterium]